MGSPSSASSSSWVGGGLFLPLPFGLPPPLAPTLPFVADADTAPELLLLLLFKAVGFFFFSTRPEATAPFSLDTGAVVVVVVAVAALPFPFPSGTWPDDADVDIPPVVKDLRDGFFANAAAAAAVVVFGCFTVVVAGAVDVRLPGAWIPHHTSQSPPPSPGIIRPRQN